MLLLRREFSDGEGCPELVLIHYSMVESKTGSVISRASCVMPPGREAGVRETFLFLPEPSPDRPLLLRYRYSTVSGGGEWYSPLFELALAAGAAEEGMTRLEELPPGNLGPAPGRGMFRMLLPLRHPAPGAVVRFGFGAMRKKPSDALCRLSIPAGDRGVPVVEAPEALSVLKARPMPYFLYLVDPVDGQLRQDKIASARITFSDASGDVVAARLLWGDAAWGASNLTVMEIKNYGEGPLGSGNHFFADDPAQFAAERQAAISDRPVPRVFEGYLAGPSGTEAEYCFHLLRRSPDGTIRAEWRNREGGGNWRITL